MTEKQKHQKLILLYYIYYLTVKVYNLLITCRVFFYVPAEPRCRSAPWIQGGWFWGVFVGVGLGWRGVCPTRSDRRWREASPPGSLIGLSSFWPRRPTDLQIPNQGTRPDPVHTTWPGRLGRPAPHWSPIIDALNNAAWRWPVGGTGAALVGHGGRCAIGMREALAPLRQARRALWAPPAPAVSQTRVTTN